MISYVILSHGKVAAISTQGLHLNLEWRFMKYLKPPSNFTQCNLSFNRVHFLYSPEYFCNLSFNKLLRDNFNCAMFSRCIYVLSSVSFSRRLTFSVKRKWLWILPHRLRFNKISLVHQNLYSIICLTNVLKTGIFINNLRPIYFSSVSLLKNLPEDKLVKIVDCLEVVSFCFVKEINGILESLFDAFMQDIGDCVICT